MNNLPLVSVIVPCYNHQQYVKECILSVINQTYTNIQLIVIDDGSKDESVKNIESIHKTYDFTFIAQKNIGLSATLNKAITEYVRGDYVALLASDDYWHVDKLRQQIAFFQKSPDYAMIFSNAALVNSSSEITGYFDCKRLATPAIFKNIILNKMGIPALTALIKRDIFDEVGLFDENLLIEDWDMWLRIAYQHKIGYQDQVLANYRSHDSNISSKIELMLSDRFKIINKWKSKEPEIYESALAYWQLYGLKALTKNNRAIPPFYLNPSKQNKSNIKYHFHSLKYRLKNL